VVGNNESNSTTNGYFLDKGTDSSQNSLANTQKLYANMAADVGKIEREEEEKLAKLKLTNLIEQQKVKIKQLERLREREEQSIRELADIRLTLSEKQFKVQKIKLEKELKQVKDAVAELLKLEKTTSSESSNKSQVATKDNNTSRSASTGSKAAESDSSSELVTLVGSIDQTLKSLLNAAQSQKEKTTGTDDQAKAIKESLEESNNSNSSNSNGTSEKNNNNNANGQSASEKDTNKTQSAVDPKNAVENGYTDDSKDMGKVDLEKITPKTIFDKFEKLKATAKGDKDLTAALNNLSTETRASLESITATDENGNYISQASQTTLAKADNLLEQIIAANDAETKLREINDKDGVNRLLVMAAEEYKARQEYAELQQKQTEEYWALESRLAWNHAHRKDILAQEEQEAKFGYLKEYQELQKDGFNHLTENMSAEEFAAIRKREDDIKKAQDQRAKMTAARQKASDIIKGKGTAREKIDQLKDHVKKTAAERDWSTWGQKYQMVDTTGKTGKELEEAKKHNEEAQKNREAATVANMAMGAAASALADFAQKLSSKTDEIAKVQGILDTRLQGSQTNEKFLNSYGKQLQRDATRIAAVSPYMSQEKLVENMQTLVAKGISYHIKQRAFLMTVQEKIASTFDAADGTLLRLIRIQQQDTTAGRLGMESALNSFLNSMYETSEYLTDVAKSVRSSLEEMQALMEGTAATELEYQVQKWMGSLYSVGMSDSVVQDIAKTFGQIASGDISGLTGSGTGNLLIMAANEAGKSIADILQDGLNAEDTNKLMKAMVNYLAEIAESSSDSRVVQQQLANVYGLKASDLRAATNLVSSLDDVTNEKQGYDNLLGQLTDMMNTIGDRTSIGEGLSNMWNNMEYTLASAMGSNPVTYLLPKMARVLKDTTGGIDIPFFNVYGFGVDLNTTVADLMSIAAMAPAALASMGNVIVGLADLVNPNAGEAMLKRAGVDISGNSVEVLARGSAPRTTNTRGANTSESGSLVSNGDGESIKDQTMQGAEEDKKKQMVEAKEEESADDIAMEADLAVVKIYNLLEEVAHGSQSLRVRVINGGVCSSTSPETNPNNPAIENSPWGLSTI
jgi:hypothetical protein